MDKDKKYDIVVLPGMGTIDEKFHSEEDLNLEKPEKNENIDVTKRHSRWMFLNNHLNNILRRKVMLEYIVQLNTEYNQDYHPYSNYYDKPNLDEDLDENLNEFNSNEKKYYQNDENNSFFSINEIDNGDFKNLNGYKKGNARFVRSNLIQHIQQQDPQYNNRIDESNGINMELHSPTQNRFLTPNLPAENNHALKFASSGSNGQKKADVVLDQNFAALSVPRNNLNQIIPNYESHKYQNSEVIEERGCEMLDSIRTIKDKAKNDILYKLMDGEWHHEKELIRIAKKSRYIGQVSFGMMMYSFKEMIDDDFMMKKVGVEGDAIYKINDSFIGLVRAAYMNYKKSVY